MSKFFAVIDCCRNLQAFQQCLRHIYYDDLAVTNDLDDLYDTLYAAKKYLLTSLVNACTNKLVVSD